MILLLTLESETFIHMLLFYIIMSLVGMLIPIQTSVNSRLSLYTKSPFYTSFISFSVGTICLIILNIIINPEVFTIHFYNNQSFNYTWIVGGLLGLAFNWKFIVIPKIRCNINCNCNSCGSNYYGCHY